MSLSLWELNAITFYGQLALDEATLPEVRLQAIEEVKRIFAEARLREEEARREMVEETYIAEDGRTLYTLKPALETDQPSTIEGE